MRNDQNWDCFFHNLEAAFYFLATLVLKKEQERQEEDREKETLKKITSLFVLPYLVMPGTWSRDHLFPLFLLLIGISLFQAFTMQNEA